MKNLSLILNFVLLIAVGILYYLHFSPGKSASSETGSSSDSTKVDISPKEIKSYDVVYVNADSLFDQYEYVKQVRKDLEGKQKGLQYTYETKMKNFQEKYYDLQQKAQSGQITADQAKIEEDKLVKQQEELEGLKANMDGLMNKTAEENQVIQAKVMDFLQRYNKDGQYKYVLAYTSLTGSILFADKNLDITGEVIDGLNAEYKTQQPVKNK